MPGRRWYSWVLPAVCTQACSGATFQTLNPSPIITWNVWPGLIPQPFRAELPPAPFPQAARADACPPELDLGMLDFLSLAASSSMWWANAPVMSKVCSP